MLRNKVPPGLERIVSQNTKRNQFPLILPLSRLARVPCRGAPEQVRRLHALTGPFEILSRAFPPQIVTGGEHGNIDSTGRESAKQERIVPCSEKRPRKRTRSPHHRIPVTPIFRNLFQVRILRENSRRGLGSPSCNAWVTVCAVADRSQIVRNRRRFYSELCNHTSLVAESLAPAVQLYDSETPPSALSSFRLPRPAPLPAG